MMRGTYYPPNPYVIPQAAPIEIDIPRVALIVVDDRNDVVVYRQDKSGGNTTFTTSSNKVYQTKFGIGIIPHGGRWSFRYPSGADPDTSITIYDLVDPSVAKGIADCMGLISDVNAVRWGGTVLTGRDVTPDLAQLTAFLPFLGVFASDRNFKGAIAPKQVTSASQVLIAANGARKGIYIRNFSPGGFDLTVCFQNATAVANRGFLISAGTEKYWNITTDGMDTSAVTGILHSAEAATDNVMVRELT